MACGLRVTCRVRGAVRFRQVVRALLIKKDGIKIASPEHHEANARLESLLQTPPGQACALLHQVTKTRPSAAAHPPSPPQALPPRRWHRTTSRELAERSPLTSRDLAERSLLTSRELAERSPLTSRRRVAARRPRR